MSNAEVPVVEVVPVKHPNADTLGLAKVWGYQCVTQNKEFPLGIVTKGVFIPPDFVVPDTADWAFLRGHRRIKTRKFRGERSEGILIAYAGHLPVGADAANELGVVKWESPADREGNGYDIHGQKQGRKNFRLRWWSLRSWYWWFVDKWSKAQSRKASPPFPVTKYDVESFHRFPAFLKGEQVIVTEKIHGTNARFVYSSRTGRLHIGSHTVWRRPNIPSWWVDASKQNPWLESLCHDNPDVVFFGEVYGKSVQSLDYGKPAGEFGIKLFDIRPVGKDWEPWESIVTYWADDIRVRDNWVPILYEGPFDDALIRSLAEGKETVSGLKLHIREGVVVETYLPREEMGLGRVKLKVINPEYLALDE